MSTQALPGPLPLPEAQWQALRACYAAPPRAYHDWRHVQAVLGHYADVAERLGWDHPREAWLALLYHDAVYEAGRTDNEARSAGLARRDIARWLPHAGLDAGRVARLIELTARHGQLGPGAVGRDEALLLDCDMAILAAPVPVYDAYERAIAEEYRPRVDAVRYRDGRARFLRGLLAAPRIFLSDDFHARCDAPARANLARALARLQTGLQSPPPPPSPQA